MIWDTFMGSQELDMLECRLVELERIPDLVHVLVEADVDHQGHPKPYHFTENLDRFARWADRLRIVRATGLPRADVDPDPWSRERAQREHARAAMGDAAPQDIVLHGDIDEIPTVQWVWAVATSPDDRVHIAMQRFHPFAVDWLHPQPWPGTVAVRWGRVESLAEVRDIRLIGYQPDHQAQPTNGGWHFSWVGGRDYALDKLGSFCHPEIADWCAAGLAEDRFYEAGWHVDGTRLAPVTVDHTWPRWIREGHAPAAWFRRTEGSDLDIEPGAIKVTAR